MQPGRGRPRSSLQAFDLADCDPALAAHFAVITQNNCQLLRETEPAPTTGSSSTSDGSSSSVSSVVGDEQLTFDKIVSVAASEADQGRAPEAAYSSSGAGQIGVRACTCMATAAAAALTLVCTI